MNGYPFGNNPGKIAGYRRFWSREAVPRPLVRFSFKNWARLPLTEFSASAAWPIDTDLTPDMVNPEEFLDEQERLLEEGDIIDDDALRGAAPSLAVRWGCGALGSTLRVLPGSVVAIDRALSWEQLGDLSFETHRHSPWLRAYFAFIDALVSRAAGRFPVSHGTMMGPLDFLVSLRGHEQAIIDLIEEPEHAELTLMELGRFFIDLTRAAWQRIPRFHGGYYDAQYHLWAPGPIARLQEDAVAVISPDLYERYVQPVDRLVARAFECCFMHLHTTSLFVLDAMLDIEELRCFQVNKDLAGPDLPALVPYFQRIQGARRSLLIRGSFVPDEVRLLMDTLDSAGLYIYLMVEDRSEIERLRPLLRM